jgi:hypothetical protein
MASLQHCSVKALATLTGSSAASKHSPLYSKSCISSVESNRSVSDLYLRGTPSELSAFSECGLPFTVEAEPELWGWVCGVTGVAGDCGECGGVGFIMGQAHLSLINQ